MSVQVYPPGAISILCVIKPPRWFVAASVIFLAVSTSLAFWGATQVGSTWDEGSLVYKLQQYFDTGWHTAAPILNGEPDPSFIFGTYVYGPVGQLLPHAVNVVLGNDSFFASVGTTASAYVGRHLGVVLWSVLGISAVALTLRLLTGSWRWGLVGATVLSSIPVWTGHAMFNIKDTPSATGYTIFTLGLVAILHTSYFDRKQIRVLALLSMVLGLVITIGTRTGLALPLVLTFPLVITASSWIHWRQSFCDKTAFKGSRRFIEGVAAFFAAYLLLLMIYPNAYLRPVEVGVESLFESASYPVNEAQLVAGVWMTQPVDWSYLPLWAWAQAPLLVSLCTLLFLGMWVVLFVRVAAFRYPNHYKSILPGALPVLSQLMLVPLGVVITSSVLYNATRQLHFVQPAMAICATLTVAWVYSKLQQRNVPSRIATQGWLILVSVGVALPIMVQIQLFPYSYIYLNSIVAMKPIDGNWPTDYWRASGPEVMRALPMGGRDSCGFEQLMKDRLVPCTDQAMFTPYLDQRGKDAGNVTLEDHEYWFVRENQGFIEIPPGCRNYSTITRRMYLQTVTIAQIAICDERIEQGSINMADPMQAE